MSSKLRKNRLEPLSEEARWTEAHESAFGELVPSFKEWYEANYNEQGNVRREQGSSSPVNLMSSTCVNG